MPENIYEDDQEMMDIDLSEMNLGNRGINNRFKNNSHDPEKSKRLFFFAGAAFLIFILIILVAFVVGNGSSENQIAVLDARIKALEERIASLGTMEGNLDSLQTQQKELEHSVSGVQSSVKSLQSKLDHVNQGVSRLNKRMGITPTVIKRTTSIRNQLINETHPGYHVVRRGESLSVIAEKYGISLKDLYQLNGLTPQSIIHPGQKIAVSLEDKE